MKRVKQSIKKRIRKPKPQQLDDDRRGSIIVVVIALLTALMVLGFFVFTMARQEKENAEYFKQASKRLEPLDFDPDDVFDCFLRQLILGAPADKYQSPFWGGHISLLPTVFGSDIHPFNGEGVNAVWGQWNPGGDGAPGIAGYDDDGDGTTDNASEYGAPGSDDFPSPAGIPASDMNYDGVADPASVAADYLMQLNQSPAAQYAIYDQAGDLDGRRRPEMDVDYTYPDHTNPFLTYIGVIRNHDGSIERPFVMPGFHRPQLMRNIVAPHAGAATNPFGPAAPPSFLTDPSTAQRVLVPHPEHRIVLPNGTVPDGTLDNHYRFVSASHPDPSGTLANFDGHLGVDESFWGGGANLGSTLSYPVDPTGRGLPNAFYMDCGFGIQEDPTTGELFVPLVAVTVLDAESLFNLNVHGNTSKGIDQTVHITDAGVMRSELLSKSDVGLSRAEINPSWALNAIPQLSGTPGDFTGTPAELDSALEQYRFYYATTPNPGAYDPNDGGALPLFRHMANMDLWNLLHGRPQFDSTVTAGNPAPRSDIQETYLGRWGEASVLLNAIPNDSTSPRYARAFPWAGASGGDDNNDANRGLDGLHPLDFFGAGRYQPANGVTRLFHLSTGRHRYPRYNSYYTQTSNRYHAFVFPNIPGTQLVNIGANVPLGGVPLVNEAEEMLLEQDLAEGAANDRFFDASQNALLQLPNLDLISNGLTGRVLNLAPYNFFANDRAEQIRSRFTSISSEPLSYQTSAKIPGERVPSGSPIAPPSWGRDTSNNDFETRQRTWEQYNANSGIYLFPPQFSNGGAPVALSYTPNTNGPGTFTSATADPFRNELRELLLSSALDNQSNRRLMRRMELNSLLDRAPNGDLRFRPLTPHPSNPGVTEIPESGPRTPEALQSAFNAPNQEYLARFDRQRLARDIFVMLYTFGGKDNIDYSATSNPYGFDPLDPTAQPAILRMAQFAVNLVDAMDPDDVVTKFEFDFDLSNGWQVDDNPYGDPAGDTNLSDRYEVFGQEEQTLCFNEALAVFAKKVRNNADTADIDHPLTEWDDRSSRQFAFVELENVSSRTVTFNNNRSWRLITRYSDSTVGTETRLFPKTGTAGTGSNSRLTIGSSNTDTLTAPAGFPALASDGETSRLRIKADPGDTSVDPIAPANTDGTMNYDLRKLTAADFDLEDAGGMDVSSNGKNLLNLNNGTLETTPNGHTVEFILQRRAHPSRAEIDDTTIEDDNPWIVVDRFRTELEVLQLVEDDDSLSEMQPKVEALKSTERIQPLIGRPDASNPGQDVANLQGARPFRASSIGEDNTRESMTLPFTMWQPHFNRQFTSTAEFFNVPLYGPRPIGDYTDPYDAISIPELTFSIGGDNPPQNATPDETSTFGFYVLNPDNQTTTPPNANDDDNRWYRILEFIKLPTRQDLDSLRISGANPYMTTVGRSGDGFEDDVFRSHGPINLNMLRHPEVLAGLMDEKEMLNISDIQGTLSRLLERGGGDFQRQEWYTSLALTRDRNDPVLGIANGTSAPVPGIPGISKPFRSLANNDGGLRSLENTMLRNLMYYDGSPGDGMAEGERQLFEIGTQAQHNSNTVDYSTKHKLLGKALNHGTSLSNTFFVFMQVDLFSAREVSPDAVRIGAKLTNSPGYRAFCVIDRGMAIDLVESNDLPPLNVPNTTPVKTVFSFNQNFNWRALVLHRQRLN